MKKQIMFLILVLTTLAILPLVFAADVPTLDSPAATGIIVNQTGLNCSVDSNTLRLVNVSFYYRNTSGSGSWQLIETVKNTSAGQTSWNTTWDVSDFWDTNNLEVNCSVMNGSSAAPFTGTVIATDTSLNVDIDNANGPTASFSAESVADNDRIASGTTFNFSISADTTTGITNCTVHLGSGTTKFITGAANNCSKSYTISDFSGTDGDTYVIRVSDANGDVTNTSQRNLYFLQSSSGGGNPSSQVSVVEEDSGDDVVEAVKEGLLTRIFSPIGNFFKSIGSWFRNLFN